MNEMITRSIYLLFVPVFMIFAILACAGTALSGVPSFSCPTTVPFTAVPTVLPGTPTLTPAPTQPPVTPVSITAPDDFYVGDWVQVGDAVRFRLRAVMDFPLDDESAYSWVLDVDNTGTAEFEIYPALQMAIIEIAVFDVLELGTWWPSTDAAADAGVELDGDVYMLAPGASGSYQLAAHAPSGEVSRLSLALDGDGNAVNWSNEPNPYC